MTEGIRNPFIIGAFVGRIKPNNVDEYLKSFVDKIESMKNGFQLHQTQGICLSHRLYVMLQPGRFLKKLNLIQATMAVSDASNVDSI